MKTIQRFTMAAALGLSPLVASAQADADPTPEPIVAPSAEPAPGAELRPAPPAELPVEVAALPAAGEPLPFSADLPTEGVAPESTIMLRSELALVDLRVRLLDENGKLVPTRDRATVGKGTSYEVRPAEPLVTGTNYRLEIDGQKARHPTDVEGTTYAVRTFAFRTSGEKPPPPPPPAAKKKFRPAKRR